MTDKLHVAVLMGGWSNEREVSLMSGNGVADALEKNGHKVSRVDMDRNIALVLDGLKPDVVFNALHGVPGEDGSRAGHARPDADPYTHSGMVSSVVAIDKELTKQQLVPAGIPMPDGKLVKSARHSQGRSASATLCLKPVNEGSSVGVAIVTDEGNYGNPIGKDVEGPWQEFDELLAEPFIKGRELTTAVVGGKAMCVTELKPKSGFYDFDAKYTDGMTDHICPADIPEEIEKLCLEYALEGA